jgi:hypothetical protein
MGERYNYNQWSVVRDGLVTINYVSNVRNNVVDVRRLQSNALKMNRGQFDSLTPDIGEEYTVFNSDPNFDKTEELTNDELFNAMTIKNIKEALSTMGVIYDNKATKTQLVQILSNAIRLQPKRLSYVKQLHTKHIASLRANRQKGKRSVNSSLLVSNHYKYSKADFDGMSKKNILRSLFDIDAYLSFLFVNVLKSKKIPKTREMIIQELDAKIPESESESENTEFKDSIYRKESIKSDRILKHNTQIILDLLFSPKNTFFVDKKQYTILGYHQENPTSQDPSQGLDMSTDSIYVTYPIKLYIDLTDKAVDKVTNKDLNQTSCHLRKEKIRKDWFDIWNTPEEGEPMERVFERKHRNSLTRRKNKGGGASIQRKIKTQKIMRKSKN